MDRKTCTMRHENGNCLPVGGFCLAVNNEICEALQHAYECGVCAQSQWINVDDRLPEERINPNTGSFEIVLCATVWGDVRAYEFGKPLLQTKPHFYDGPGVMDKYVTHWKYLPEPPKEVSE